VTYYVYLLRCRDDTLYCGITNDLARRIAAHQAGTGARYTRGRGPLTLVFARRCRDKSMALRLEYAIKQLPRDAKLALDVQRVRRLARRLGAIRAP
jgi:putative endonuclease